MHWLLLVFVDLDLTFRLQPHPQSKEFQPSHVIRSDQAPTTRHQRMPQVLSVLEDAGEVLCQVRRRRRILEENLQALQRRSSGEALKDQLEALVSNRSALAHTDRGLTAFGQSSGSCYVTLAVC